jgi:hypothetical protein
VLQNKGYIKFAAANSVEVICMEEIGKAEREKASTIKTYKTKDPYGDEVEYLVEFAGLTLDDLKDISNNSAVLAFMDAAGKIPYTAIVDPHTGKAIEAFGGKPTVKSLSTKIASARKKLEAEHGKGVPRKQWNELGKLEISVDLLLANEKYVEALAAQKKARAKFKRPRPAVKTRLEAMRASIDKDIGKHLDECAKNKSLSAKEKAALAKLAKALGEGKLAERAKTLSE